MAMGLSREILISDTTSKTHVVRRIPIRGRRLLHVNVTAHPTTAWTVQQFREILAAPHPYRFVLHDRDSIYLPRLDAALPTLGVRDLRTPVPAPTANAYCERLLGSLRRECLEYLIPLRAMPSGRGTAAHAFVEIQVWAP